MSAAWTIAPVGLAPLVRARRVASPGAAAAARARPSSSGKAPSGRLFLGRPAVGTIGASVRRAATTEETRSPWTDPAPPPSSAWEPARSDWQPPWVRRALLGTAVVVAAVAYIAAVSVHYTEAMAADVMDVNEPSIMNLKLKPRTQEVILETKAEHINEDFSHEDLVGAIYTEGDLRGSDFSGSDLRAAIFSRAVMPGVNLEGADMSNSFLDYVVLRGANMRGVIARRPTSFARISATATSQTQTSPRLSSTGTRPSGCATGRAGRTRSRAWTRATRSGASGSSVTRASTRKTPRWRCPRARGRGEARRTDLL